MAQMAKGNPQIILNAYKNYFFYLYITALAIIEKRVKCINSQIYIFSIK